MARRFIIENIVNLIKAIGGNPNKFMGTKTNISFLGKGPKQALLQGQIDIRSIAEAELPIERVISEAETAGGYAVANKLNDIQLQRLEQNLIQLKKLYAPDPVANITDMATRTGDLTQEGLGSLRAGAEGLKRFPEETHQFMGRPLKDADFAKIDQLVSEGKIPGAKGSQGVEVSGIDDLLKSDFNKAAGVPNKFNPRNEIHVNKAKALLEDPQIKGVYTEAEVKNAWDFEGLYQSHFDKGHVDVARLLEQEGHNIPEMRSAARDALLQLMKKESKLPGAEGGLRDFVTEVDFKFISEGGGGREGDPINLMVKYFGKKATENLPKNATKENIDSFTDFIMAAKDSRGRGINDPFFEREAIDFSEFVRSVDEYVPPFATGGRVGFKFGSRTIAKGALAFLKKNKKNSEYMFKASDNVSPGYAHGDTKYNAELLAEQLAEDAGVVYDDLDHVARSEFYGTAYEYLSNEMAQVLLQKRMLKDVGQKMQLSEFDITGRKPNASGGLAKILEV